MIVPYPCLLQFSNFELSAELKVLLHRWVDAVHAGGAAAAYDTPKMQSMLELQQVIYK